MSAGTLYPILHNMERDQLLIREDVNINGKIRKYYQITERGDHVLQEARAKAYELFKEIKYRRRDNVTQQPNSQRRLSTLLEILLTSIKLGLTSFGGPVAHLAYFKDEYIDRRKWLGD